MTKNYSKIIALLIIIGFTFNNVFAQERCGTMQIHKKLMITDAVYKAGFEQSRAMSEEAIASRTVPVGTVYKVPIVVHIIHKGEAVGTGTNISDAQIYSAIHSLNDAYRKVAGTSADGNGVDTEIEFVLAARDPSGNPTNGINRVNGAGTADYSTNGITSGGVSDNEVTIKALSKWDNTKYYNCWVVSEIENNEAGTGTQGYAYFPGAGPTVDGAVMLYNGFGYDPDGTWGFNLKSYTSYNRTLIHEIGHGLDLNHTFEGDNDGATCPANSSCSTQGDLCCDTPPHKRTASDCPTGTNNTCTGTSLDLVIHNYMDYSGEECQNEFTADQTIRMRATLTGTRASLTTSTGLNPTTSPVSNFLSKSNAGCVGSSVEFLNLTKYNPTGYSWSFPGSSTTTSILTNPTVTYTSSGKQNVSLTSTNASGTGAAETKSEYIQVYATPVAAGCTPQTTDLANNYGMGIQNFTLGTMVSTSGGAVTDGGYKNFMCSKNIVLQPSTTYSVSVTVGAANPEYIKVYCDYNNDGDFADTGELIYNPSGSATGIRTGNFTTPASPTSGSLLRLRAMSDFSTIGNSCTAPGEGQVEDYGVYFNPAFPASVSIAITSGTNPSCSGSSVTFTATPTNGGTSPTYQWKKNGANVGTNSATFTTTTLANSDAITCVMTSNLPEATGSPATSNTITMTIDAAPTVSAAGSDQSVCATSATMAGNSPTTGTGAWSVVSGSGNFTNSASATTSVSSLGVGANTFRWTISNGTCASSTDDVVITRNASPTTSNAGPDQTTCGTTATLAGNTPTAGTGAWSLISGSGSITNSASPTSGLTALGVGNNTFRWTISSTGCTPSTDDVTINVSTGLTQAAAGSDQAICADNGTLAGNTPTSGTGTWSVISGAGSFSNAGSPTSNVTGIGVGSNTYRWTISGTGCSSTTDDVIFTRSATPTTAAAGPDQTICGNSTTLAGNTATTGTGAWSLVSGSGTITTESSPTSTLTALGSGANVFRWTISNGSCTPSTDDVTINSGGLSLPFAEAFEGTTFPPDGWSIVNPNSNVTWVRSTTAGGISGSTGSAFMDNYSTDITGQIDELISPNLSFTGLGTASLDFKAAYARYNNTYKDTLKIYVSQDCGSNWTLISTKYDTALTTTSDKTSAWSPTLSTEWKNHTINLNAYAGQSGVKIKFRNASGYGNNMYLDNINVTGEALTCNVTATASKTDNTCNGSSDGTATVAATGGTTPYAYAWSGGGTSSTITGKAAGTYTATVTDANGCTATATAIITQPSAISATTTTTNVLCNGGSNGTATVTASGGTGTLAYTWTGGGTASTITGKTAGSYTVTVTDANGCTKTSVAIITQPSALTASTSSNNITCNGLNNGSASAFVAGGTGTYTYLWSPGGVSAATANSLAAGTYTVTVTDENACTKTATAVIVNPPALTAAATSTDITCNGLSNGTATVTAAGGTGTHTYTWMGGGTTSTITGKSAGTYTATVTDANGCTKTGSTIITQPSAISSATSSTIAGCGEANGTASVTASGGTGSFSYSWSNGNNTANATGLAAGSYNINVTDANGCSVNKNVVVSQEAGPGIPQNRISYFVTETGATLKWDSVENASFYKIIYKVQGTTKWVGYLPTQNTFMKITGLDSATSYEWRVRAFVSPSCYSYYSLSSMFQTIGGTCPRPRFPNSSNITTTSAMLNWSHPKTGPVNHYRIKVKKTTEGWPVNPTYTTREKFINAINLEPGVSYNWAVGSSCNSNGTPASAWVYGTMFTTGSGAKVLSMEEYVSNAPVFAHYPNPAMDQLTIELFDGGNSTITISDLQGKTLMIKNENAGPGEKINMDINSLTPGFYFIKLQSENGFATSKFVIER